MKYLNEDTLRLLIATVSFLAILVLVYFVYRFLFLLFKRRVLRYNRVLSNQAVELFKKSADQGYANAQSNLALMYYNGEGVQKDYKQAVEWFKKSANQGNADAQFNLGNMYIYGKGVQKDYKQAAYWFSLSCNGGLKEACLMLKN